MPLCNSNCSSKVWFALWNRGYKPTRMSITFPARTLRTAADLLRAWPYMPKNTCYDLMLSSPPSTKYKRRLRSARVASSNVILLDVCFDHLVALQLGRLPEAKHFANLRLLVENQHVEAIQLVLTLSIPGGVAWRLPPAQPTDTMLLKRCHSKPDIFSTDGLIKDFLYWFSAWQVSFDSLINSVVACLISSVGRSTYIMYSTYTKYIYIL